MFDLRIYFVLELGGKLQIKNSIVFIICNNEIEGQRDGEKGLFKVISSFWQSWNLGVGYDVFCSQVV